MTSQATISDRLKSAAERMELGRADFAQLVGTNTRTIARWFAQETEPQTDSRRRLLEILAVLEALSGVLQPQAAHDWLYSPNVLVKHEKPIDLLAAGDWRDVMGLVDALREGIFV